MGTVADKRVTAGRDQSAQDIEQTQGHIDTAARVDVDYAAAELGVVVEFEYTTGLDLDLATRYGGRVFDLDGAAVTGDGTAGVVVLTCTQYQRTTVFCLEQTLVDDRIGTGGRGYGQGSRGIGTDLAGYLIGQKGKIERAAAMNGIALVGQSSER